MVQLVDKIAQELALKSHQVANTVQLLFDEECTIPFVARYRKEMTGSLDEVALRNIRDRYAYLEDLESTKAKYLKVVEAHCKEKPELKGKWEELQQKFQNCQTKQELEDLYLPFKPKRRTKATIAKEKGLEPLLEKIIAAASSLTNLEELAKEFITPENSDAAPTLRVNSTAEALAGAADIYSERFAEDAQNRAIARKISEDTGQLISKKIETSEEPATDKAPKGRAGGKKKSDASKYENYFDYAESIKTAVSHRIMAVRRGEAEKILKVSIVVDSEKILDELKSQGLEGSHTDAVKGFLSGAIESAYKRLISPSIETELRLKLKSLAEQEAIKVFSENLENLLLLPPIPGKTVLGIDPGLRTGSKLAIVDDTGKLLANDTIYPDPGYKENDKTEKAKRIVGKFIEQHKVQYIAIGNGTGSREIGRLVTSVLKSKDAFRGIKKLVVNEAGASVYSTDDIAREEFPDLDATIRSAVSIARRLQDPLAELVKIDPRSIGVGQYQHDVNPTRLNKSLAEVVESCVNKVGVNVNTASYSLLSYVSGIGKSLAKSIVKDRDSQGKFQDREALSRVSGFGPKAFEQAAGFLRVPDSTNPLDNSAVHPERYSLVEDMVKSQSKPIQEVVGNTAMVEGIQLEQFVSDSVGMPTLKDSTSELLKPGRDPREDGTRLIFSDDISELEDLEVGMSLPGTVTNVTAFGAFVDIGVHQDGLVHISELSDTFVDDPAKVVSVGEVIKARVLDVDMKRRRISLSLKSPALNGQGGQGNPRNNSQKGRPAQGKMSQNTKRGPLKPRSGGRKHKAKEEKTHTVEDLMAKFNRR